MKNILLIAMGLLMIAAFYYFYNLKTEPQVLFEQHFNAYLDINISPQGSLPINPNRTTIAVIPPSESTPAAIAKFMLDKAVRAYNLQDYIEAVHQFDSYLQTGEADPKKQNEVRFYMAVAKLAINDTKSAQLIFADLADDSAKKHTFQEEAQWYLALSYLKAENIPDAKKALKKIKRENPYSQKAERLLSQI
jgi:TolA-binding protein